MLKKILIPALFTLFLSVIFTEKAHSQEAHFAISLSWSNIVPGEPSYGVVIVKPHRKYIRQRYYYEEPVYPVYEAPVYHYYEVPVYRYYGPVYYYKHDNGKHKGWYKKKYKHRWHYDDDEDDDD